MNDVKPVTTNEIKLCKGIQNAIGALPNAIIGNQTLTDIARVVNANCFPITVKLYDIPVIIGRDLIPFKGVASVSSYMNSLSGSFTYPRAKLPCSIMVYNGEVIRAESCHQFENKPESVIYRTRNGTVNIKRCRTAAELPSGLRWAIGGMGLLDFYNPSVEGFTGKYADVLNKTAHTVLGVKGEHVYGFYFKNQSAKDIDALLKKYKLVDTAILLDGGGIAAMNGAESFAKINTKQPQGYLIQFI